MKIFTVYDDLENVKIQNEDRKNKIEHWYASVESRIKACPHCGANHPVAREEGKPPICFACGCRY